MEWWWVVYLGMMLGIVHLMDHHLNLHLHPHPHHPTTKKMPPLPLRFNHDASFKILQVADLHYANGPTTRCQHIHPSHSHSRCSDLNSTLFLRRLIAAENPDFIAFTGDNIFGPSASDAAESLFAAFAPAVDSRIPWAAVLGNHDHESAGMGRQEILFLASLMDFSLARVYPNDNEHHNIDGFGNYNVRIFGPAGSPTANTSLLNLIFLDSGHRHTVDGRRTYGWIRDSQLRWMSIDPHLHRLHQRQLAFFHIPIPELRDHLMYDYANKIVGGSFQEAVACSFVHSGALRSLLSLPGLTAVFHGHDHVNDFCANLTGVWFCYGGGFGYHAYGRRGWPRRARLVESHLRDDRLSSIHTWKRLDDPGLTKIDHHVLWEA